ncbi:MAG: VTT domain-containing protein [Verrucomicrobiae bacterium]|nr:VTT domain-containing protein [Verrucomicrobiae bacterium]
MPSESGIPEAAHGNARPAAGHHLVLGLVLLALAAWFGTRFGHQLPALESWVAQQGALGWLIFVAAAIVGTSLFIPDTVFAVAAGALFGFAGGAALMTTAVLLTATLNFTLARRWLRGPVRRWIEHQPRLAAVERAVGREGLRFLFLLRLTPLSPVAVSYLLGTTSTRFGPFLATSLGILPTLWVEVYLGHVAGHIVRVAANPGAHRHLHTLLTVSGLVVAVLFLAYVTRIARKAIAEAEAAIPAEPAGR